MFPVSSVATRRSLLAAAVAAGASSVIPGARAFSSEGPVTNAIQPFLVEFPDQDLADLRRRVATTRWPERETVMDDSQGVRLTTVRQLAEYWQTDHDWRK